MGENPEITSKDYLSLFISAPVKETKALEDVGKEPESQTAAPAGSENQETDAAPDGEVTEEDTAAADGREETGTPAEDTTEAGEDLKEDETAEGPEDNQGEETEHQEKVEEPEKSEKPGKPEVQEEPEQSGKVEEPEKSEKSEKAEEQEKSEQSGKVSDGEKAEPVAAVIRHYAPIVAEPEETDEKDGYTKETEIAGQKIEKETETPVNEESGRAEESEPSKEKPAGTEAESAPDTEEETAKPTEESVTASGAESAPAADGESAAPDMESTEETKTDTVIKETEAEETNSESEAGKESGTPAPEETPARTEAAAKPSTATPSNGTAIRPGATDLVGMGYCSTAKIYATTLKELKALDDIAGYRVSYEIAPEKCARIMDGPRSVEEGECLSFDIQAKEGYGVVSVTANGVELNLADKAEDKPQPVTDTQSDTGLDSEKNRYTYTLDEIMEDQEIVVEVAPVSVPAAVYTAETDDIIVTVSVPDGAFEENVELRAARIEDEEQLKQLSDQASRMLEPGKAIADIMAYDVSFLSDDGEELEPAKPVDVSMSFKKPVVTQDKETLDISKISVIHLPDEGPAETVAETGNLESSEIGFTLDSFSTIALFSETSSAATIGDIGYETVTAAIEAAQDGDVIRLEKDLTTAGKNGQGGENVMIVNKTLTIDTNGKRWSGQKKKPSLLNPIPDGVQSVITVTDSTLTLIGNGTIIGYGKYRVITAENTNLIIGDENGGPTLTGTKGSSYANLDGETNSQMGGVILSDRGSLILNSGTITNGAIPGSSTSKCAYGGGVAVRNGTFTMYGGSIEENWVQPSYYTGTNPGNYAYGGGVYLKEASFEMYGGKISNNYAKNTKGNWKCHLGIGGGIYSDSSSVLIDGGEINGNYAKGTGGGIWASFSDVVLRKGCVNENIVSGDQYMGGGGIYLNTKSTLAVEDGTISNNSNMTSGGGGIFGTGLLTISGGEISGNKAKKDGGGISSNNLHMTGGVVSGNNAEGNGGGIYLGLTAPDAQITGAGITGNTAKGQGGGIFCSVTQSGKKLSLGSVTVADNTALQGGGVAASGSVKNVSLNIADDTLVYDNKATGDDAATNNDNITASISDEFLFVKDTNFNKVGFEKNENSPIHDATKHVITVPGKGDAESIEYTLVRGGISKSASNIGYYNYWDIEIDQDKCVGSDDIYLDPAGASRHYVWTEDNKAVLLTKDNGLFTSLKDAYAAAQEKENHTIYVCSPVPVTASDEVYLNNPDVVYKRCGENHSSSLFAVQGKVTMNGTHIDGAGVNANTAMVSVPTSSTLYVTGETILENGNNPDSLGGAINVYGTLEMDGGSVRKNHAKGGGGIYVYGSSAKAHFEGGELTDNEAVGDGGAIYVRQEAVLNIGTDETANGRTVIKNNICGSEGGGITLNDFSKANVYRADIVNNTDTFAGGYAGGGGIHIWAGCTMHMKNLYITKNRAEGGYKAYGALYSCPTGKLAVFDLDGALVVDNGAGVPDIMFNSSVNTNPVFVSNVALGGGDIIYRDSKGGIKDPSEYQYVKKGFSLYSDVSPETKSDAESIATAAGVYMTGNTGYAAGSAIANNGTLIIGTETEALQVVKEWKDDAGNKLSEHPDEVLVYLTKTVNGQTTMVKTDGRSDGYVSLNEQNNWSYTWTNLSAVKNPGDGAKIITWGVAEAGIDGFTGSSTEPEKLDAFEPIEGNVYQITLTNTKSEIQDKGSLTVGKAVYADGTDESDRTFGFTASLDFSTIKGNTGTYSYYVTGADGTRGSLRPVYDTNEIKADLKNGESFTIEGIPYGTAYAVQETEGSRKDYRVYVNDVLTEGANEGVATGVIEKGSSGSTSIDVAFTNVETVSVKGTKDWRVPEGTRIPDSIHVKLMQTAGEKTVEYNSKDVSAGADGAWNYEWTELPGYDSHGNRYAYTVEEENPYAYSKDIQFDEAAGLWKITNTLRTGTFDVEVYKVLTGKVMTAGQFTFQLMDSDGNVAAEARNGIPDADGRASVRFTDVPLPEYDGKGDYVYTVHEVNDNQPGYQYDGAIIEVSVRVSVDADNDAGLVADVTLNTEKGTFENVYKRGDASFIPSFAKRISGRDFNSTDEYTFTMVKTMPDGTVTKESRTISPDNGTYCEGTFSTSTFGMSDVNKTYTYEIYEEGGSVSNVTYDTRHYVIKVTVTDDGNENLTATAVSEGGTFTAASFTNTYTEPQTDRPGGGSGGGGGNNPGGGRYTGTNEVGPGVTIPPADVPLAETPLLIDDGEIPLVALPKTGQSSVRTTFIMMMSGIMVILTAIGRRRREDS